MRIKKVYIKNFKGVRDKKIIDFSDGTTLLSGPNGFGKTTIFDVIELCITGELERIKKNSNVTKDNKDYKKPFYQNETGKDVVIKVWLEHEEENLIIVRFLSRIHSGTSTGRGRKNKVSDFKLLKLYKDNKNEFEDDEFIPDKSKNLNKKQIEEFFNIKGMKIEDIYKMFNYVQQEEVMYFLRKTEDERKNSLDCMFKTSDKKNIQDNLSKFRQQLEGIKKSLDDKIEEVVIPTDKKHTKIFGDLDIDFDQKDLFESMTIIQAEEEKKVYFKYLDSIKEFLETFSVDEYNKKIKSEKLNKILKEERFLNHIVLSEYEKDEYYQELKKDAEVLVNKAKIKKYILRKIAKNCLNYKNRNSNIDKYSKFLNIKEYEEQLKETMHFLELINEDLAEYKELIENRNTKKITSDTIGKTINEIINLRNDIKDSFEKMRKNEKDVRCPYCGEKYNKYVELSESFEKRAKILKQMLDDEGKSVVEIDARIKKEYINKIIEKMQKYTEDNKLVENDILDILKDLQDKEVDFSEFQNKGIPKEYIWETLKTSKELDDHVNKIIEIIEQKSKVDKEVYKIIEDLRQKDFSGYYIDLDEFSLRDETDKYKISFKHVEKIQKSYLEEQIEKTKQCVEAVKIKFKYDGTKSDDENEIYKKYFNTNEENLKKIDDEKLSKKREYIEIKLLQKKNSIIEKYKNRRDKLKKIIEKIKCIEEIYKTTLENYKKDMVNKIKIPFFIYNAKILQNYQQGIGVFLSVDERNNSVRFLTDNTTDHDAIHHLSTGQLSVIAVAFCLAANSTYNIAHRLQFLLIDDPIQEMDILNIHSFIELIRHEFIDDYQLIFSTHDIQSTMYMKYKFEKIQNKEVKYIDVQREFFE